MQRAKIRSWLLVWAAFLWLLPSLSQAETKKRTCGPQPGHSLQHFLDELNPGDTLLVSGTCNESVVIGEGRRNLTIDGQGSAVIDGSADSTRAAVQIRGRGITIKGFTIIGGRFGVQVHRGGTAVIDGNLVQGGQVHGIVVVNGSFAQILNNTVGGNYDGVVVTEGASADIGFRGDFAVTASPNLIQNNSHHGIIVNDSSNAEIESNTISGNGGFGILVSGNSQARVGSEAATPSSFSGPNTIENNGDDGILVSRSSAARIISNTIRNNGGNGVGVTQVAHASIASNVINNNAGDGVFISLNSAVNLGRDTGSNPDDLPNTTTSNNGGFGVHCVINGSADGRLGSLNGSSGPGVIFVPTPSAPGFFAGCVNSLNP